MLSKRFFIIVALISSLVIGSIYPINNILRVDEGYRLSVFLEDFAWGTFYTLLIWSFNIYWFPWLINYFFTNINKQLMNALRVLLSFLFGGILVHLNELYDFLHIELPGYWSHELANEVRGGITTAIILLLYYMLNATSAVHRTTLENERLIKENTTAQFESLKQQIHPHFLFNSLNILKAMVRAKDPKSEEYVLRLSDFYRSLLLNRDKEKSTLEEELQLLEHYIFMLEARFENKIQFKINISEAQKASLHPPLTLQLLVENCIKHNVVSVARPLYIDIFDEDNWIVVRNNMQAKRTVEKTTNLGLENINKRYELIGQKSIQVEKSEEYFTVRLPIIKN